MNVDSDSGRRAEKSRSDETIKVQGRKVKQLCKNALKWSILHARLYMKWKESEKSSLLESKATYMDCINKCKGQRSREHLVDPHTMKLGRTEVKLAELEDQMIELGDWTREVERLLKDFPDFRKILPDQYHRPCTSVPTSKQN